MTASLTTVCINCTVSMGGLGVSTPYIKSFSVNRSRGSQGTASASIKVLSSFNAAAGESFSISCRSNGTVFTGTIVKASASPCFDDPAYVIINVEAEDAWRELTGKKFTRRCRSSLSRWASVDGISRSGLRDTGFQKQKAKDVIVSGGEYEKSRADVSNRTNSALDNTEMPKPGRGYNRREVNLTYAFIT